MAIMLSCVLLVSSLFLQDEKPTQLRNPMSKVEERRKFHEPSVRGMDMAIRLKAHDQRERMKSESLFKNIPWRNIGPETQGGRVVDIHSPINLPNRVLVAFATGGLWQTDSDGIEWKPIFDDQSAFGIGDFDVSADGTLIWVGTGENNSQRTSYSGTGMFKSEDAGATWQYMGLPESHHIGRVIIDPRNRNTVWVAALGHLYSQNDERGVYKTTDGGRTWAHVLKVDERTGAIDMVMDPRDSRVVYVSFWDRDRRAWNMLESGPGSAVFKTSDAGKSWEKLSGLPSGEAAGRTGIAISASKPDTVYAYIDNQAPDEMAEKYDEFTAPGNITMARFRAMPLAVFLKLERRDATAFLRRYLPRGTDLDALFKDMEAGKVKKIDLENKMLEANAEVFDSPIALAQVWRSDDAGKTWRKTTERMGDHGGYYWNKMTVHPKNPEEVYTLGVELLRSRNGGLAWDEIATRNHVDHHAYYIDPRDPRKHWNGNDGGIYLSLDGGDTWRHLNNLPVGQPTTIAVDNKVPYNVYIGLQDNGTMKGPSTYVIGGRAQWTSIGGGDGSAIAVDPRNDGDLVYVASQFGAHSAVDQVNNRRWSTRAPNKEGEPRLRYNWISPLIISPHHPDIIYLGSQKLHRSFNQGRNWEDLSGDLTKDLPNGDVPFSTLTQIAESPFRFGRIYIGADDGTVKYTPDSGVTWIDISTPAKDRWVTRIVASKWDEGTVYVTQNGYRQDEWTAYVWKSTDFGKTWTSIVANLPFEPVNTIREDPTRKGLLYVGTDMGVYASLDAGASWFAYGKGMPNTPIHDLAIQARDKEMVVASHARSVWKVSVALLQEITDEIMKKTLHLYQVANLTGRDRWPYERYQPYSDNPPRDPQFTIQLWSIKAGPGKIRLLDKDGKTAMERDATIDRGINFLSLGMLVKPGDRWAPFAGKTPPATVEEALADPYAARRAQYVPAGDYTLEIEIGGEKVSQSVKISA